MDNGVDRILHMRNRGIKSVRAIDRVNRRLADHVRRRGKEQEYRPPKSPTLNTRKCTPLKIRGCVLGFVDCIDAVMGGNTD